MNPVELDIPLLPSELAGAVVVPDMKCRACGYNLRGLLADGQCPECGLDIWQTIIRETDPEASRLPSLRDARGVGNGLFGLMLVMLCSALILVSEPLFQQLEAWGVGSLDQQQFKESLKLPYLAGVMALAGLWSIWKLRPTSGEHATPTVWSDIRLLTMGLIGWSVLIILLGSVFLSADFAPIRHSAMIVAHGFAASVFVGLRGIFKSIGERSRAYRRAKGGQQNLGTMVAAIIGVAMADGIRLLNQAGFLGDLTLFVSSVMTWICSFMIILGLVYLTANAWWIRQSMTRPPRSLDELLMPALPEDSRLPEEVTGPEEQ